MRRVGLLGGTFNPPHAGHLHAARAALEGLALDALWFLPDAEPPHKVLPPGTPTAQDRVEMTRRLASLLPRAEVCTLEQELPAPSYTARTLGELARRCHDTSVVPVVGSDMFFTLDRWYRPDVIFRHAEIAALARRDEDTAALDGCRARLREQYGARVSLLYADVLEVSSTALREALRRGEYPEALTEPVAAYIRERGLYR